MTAGPTRLHRGWVLMAVKQKKIGLVLIDKIADTLAPIRKRIETILPADNPTDRSPGIFGTMNASIDIILEKAGWLVTRRIF